MKSVRSAPGACLFLSSAIISLLLSGCHRLESVATQVVGVHLKDPDSLQLRNVHRGRVSDGTICGEYNAKNTFGGYVGFKSFAIDTTQQNSLIEIDDETPEDSKLDYAINCGNEEQRSQAAVARMIEKEEARKADIAARKVAPAPSTPNGQSVGNHTPLAPALPVPVSFSKPDLPTPIEQTQCHMGECSWEQITVIVDVTKNGNDVLRKAVTRQTSTETPNGQDYPSMLPPGKRAWEARTSYFLCSLKRPASIDWNPDTKDWLVTQLTVISPFGYEVAAVADYKRACHGIKPGSNLDQHPDQLGYVDRDDVSQLHVKKLTDVFGL